ncbi:MAG TPA: hypothetical protein VGL61_26395 [Kofleriaceae bacterium]|jgi:hypothetical protein
MTTLSLTDLATITGGANRAGCPTPAQFDWMKANMVPNDMSKPGVQKHVVQNDARRCGFPVPK